MRQLVVSIPADREEYVLEALEQTCQLKNLTRTTDGRTSKISCYVAATECGVVLHELDKVGCGTAYGKVALLPVHLLKPLPNFRDRHLTTLVKESSWGLKGRMATEEIYTSVINGTELSFDYLAFVVVAALIASVGLATNSSVMIVASMLVSPLMGPILAFAFGTSVQDFYLIQTGLVTEAVGVCLTFLVGFIVGLVVSGWTTVAHFYDWPTAEMLSRGEASGLLVGVFFAVPSGAGVALSTTQGGTNALVGVAIAASLLPPIANTGMCLAFAAAGADKADLQSHAFFRIAWMSFLLFLINVGCIYFVCIFLFWIKKIRKVRKQLLQYQDLPRIQVKTKELGMDQASQDGSRPRPSTPGTLAAEGGAAGSNGRHQMLTAGALATVAGLEAAPEGGVTIKVSNDAAPKDNLVARRFAGRSGGGRRGSPAPSRTEGGSGSGSGSGFGSRLTGFMGNLVKGQVSGLSNKSGSTRSDAASRRGSRGSAGGGRGWRKVRKVVLEDERFKEMVEDQKLQEQQEEQPTRQEQQQGQERSQESGQRQKQQEQDRKQEQTQLATSAGEKDGAAQDDMV